MVGPVNLPAGSYQARIWFPEGLAHDGEVVVSSSDRAVYARLRIAVQNRGELSMRLTVAASTYFRPSESDPASTDTRGLGCQVRVGLE